MDKYSREKLELELQQATSLESIIFNKINIGIQNGQ